MVRNMTFAVEEEILKKAKKVAIEKNTTLPKLMRNFLQRLADQETQKIEEVASELSRCFANKKVKVGPRYWKRADLHER